MVGNVGKFLAAAGVLSIVLNFIGWNLKILMWIDNWGTGAGWGIRIGIVVLGVVLILVGKKMEEA